VLAIEKEKLKKVLGIEIEKKGIENRSKKVLKMRLRSF
jgi:hypothetical protein